jgi:bla regulator protein blaR1
LSLLEKFVASPFAAAIGWTLLHSLWEGTLLAVLLAAVLLATRSPRARDAAACAALLLMLGGFTFTLIHFIPQGTHGLLSFKPPTVSAWNPPAAKGAANFWKPGLAAIAPWLAPFWISGVLFLYLRSLAGCVSVQRLRRRGVCGNFV